METTLEYAGTHFPQLLKLVTGGEEVVLRDGNVAVARIVPVRLATRNSRPKVGEVTSKTVRWTPASFEALDDEGLNELGFS
jgi:antitoxin (DNA-binding transcriptional repressor) of toxin-antitoxin stability system